MQLRAETCERVVDAELLFPVHVERRVLMDLDSHAGIETVRRDNCGLVRTMIDQCLKTILMDRDTQVGREPALTSALDTCCPCPNLIHDACLVWKVNERSMLATGCDRLREGHDS